MELELVSEGDAHAFAGVRNILISLYSGTPHASILETRLPWVQRGVDLYEKLGLLVMITREAAGILPDRAFRQASKAQADRFRSSIAFSATVIKGDDLGHRLIRTFLRGMAVVSPHEIEVRFFRQPRPAIEWACELAKPHGGPSPEELDLGLQTLRARRKHSNLIE